MLVVIQWLNVWCLTADSLHSPPLPLALLPHIQTGYTSADPFCFGAGGKFQPHQPQPRHIGASIQPDSLNNFNKTPAQTPFSALLSHFQGSLVASPPFPLCSLLGTWRHPFQLSPPDLGRPAGLLSSSCLGGVIATPVKSGSLPQTEIQLKMQKKDLFVCLF